MKKALIIGISGQDGAYLSKLLLGKGYLVYGTSRDVGCASFRALRLLGAFEKVHLHSMNPRDYQSVSRTLARFQPDEVYNLAGQSSVAMSFDQPAETIESITLGTLHLLQAARSLSVPMRIFNAGSVECFGQTEGAATEETPFKPLSPYGVGKAAAHWQIASYRQNYGLFACTGILSNHESPVRSEQFVTKKTVAAACRIARGSKEVLSVDNLDVARDWGWAEEYATAMWLMLQQPQPEDYVIATGSTHVLRELVRHAFRLLGLDWASHTRVRSEFVRASGALRLKLDPSKAFRQIGWQAQITMPEVIRRMIVAEMSGSSPTLKLGALESESARATNRGWS